MKFTLTSDDPTQLAADLLAFPAFEESFGDELPDHLLRRVGVDLDRPAEHADRREAVAGPELTGKDRLAGRERNLLVDGTPGFQIAAKRDHRCTMTRVTLKIKLSAIGHQLSAQNARPKAATPPPEAAD